jgi:hypothetical protein
MTVTRSGGGDLLSAADASNVVLDAKDQVNAFLMAGLLGPGGFVSQDGVADITALRAGIAERLGEGSEEGTNRLAACVRADRRGYVWEPCAPDLTQQVRAVDTVAGEAGLAQLCASLMTTPLRTDRPLWEVLVVPGAWERGPGVVVRFHHAVSDGVGAVELVERLLGSRPVVQPSTAPRRKTVATRHSVGAMIAGVARVAAMFRTAVPPTVLLGSISGQRGVAFVNVELDRLSHGAKAAGGTVNDALLAAVAMAAELTLASDGQPVPDSIPVSVPVALPDRGGTGNAVGIMRVELPTGEQDPALRVARIAAVTRTAKSEARAQGTFELTRTRWGSRVFAWLARRQRFIALFVTNVRGPSEQMVLCGAPLEMAWAVTPIQGNVRLGISALSYRGRLGCAIHVDAAALRADVVAAGLREQLGRIAI